MSIGFAPSLSACPAVSPPDPPAAAPHRFGGPALAAEAASLAAEAAIPYVPRVPTDLAVLETIFIFVFGPPPTGGPGGGSGLSFPEGKRGFWADPSPDPGGNDL